MQNLCSCFFARNSLKNVACSAEFPSRTAPLKHLGHGTPIPHRTVPLKQLRHGTPILCNSKNHRSLTSHSCFLQNVRLECRGTFEKRSPTTHDNNKTSTIFLQKLIKRHHLSSSCNIALSSSIYSVELRPNNQLIREVHFTNWQSSFHRTSAATLLQNKAWIGHKWKHSFDCINWCPSCSNAATWFFLFNVNFCVSCLIGWLHWRQFLHW